MLKIDSNKIQISWWDMSDLIKDLTAKIPFEVPLADSIYGIPRGGLIPAVMLSHSTGLPLVNTISKNTLVVDDMTDSGITMDKIPGQFTAVLYHKPHTSCFTPNVWSKLHKGNEWLVFPWEDFKAPAKQDYLQSNKSKQYKIEKSWIYESPDGGKTVTRRRMGDNKKELLKNE